MENHLELEEIMDSLDLWNTPTFTNSPDLSIDDSFNLQLPSFTPYSIEPSDIEGDSITSIVDDDDSIVYLYTIDNANSPPNTETRSIFPRHPFFIQSEVSNRKLLIKFDPMVKFSTVSFLTYNFLNRLRLCELYNEQNPHDTINVHINISQAYLIKIHAQIEHQPFTRCLNIFQVVYHFVNAVHTIIKYNSIFELSLKCIFIITNFIFLKFTIRIFTLIQL
jgi:hypothetical protein